MQQGEPLMETISHLFRQQAGKMTAALIRLFGFSNIAVAEDIVQDTFLSACQNWHYAKMPANPAAWLMHVAKNKAINVIKKDARLVSLTGSAFYNDNETALTIHIEQVFTEKEINDSQLKLLFLCCHPDISPRNQLIITLHIHCGFSNKEIANAMLMNAEAVKKCIYRTKNEIKEKKLYNTTIYHLQSVERIEVVHKVLYLMFNEGYKTTEDIHLINKDICFEAMRLSRILFALHTENGATAALLALMFFNIARFPARVDEENNIIPLHEQDRNKWDKPFINEAFYYLEKSRTSNSLSRYHIEAAISAIHCTANCYEDTDWQVIIMYYDQLSAIDANPIIQLNKAIALSHLHGTHAGLNALEQIKGLENYYLFSATKGDIFYRQKKYDLAIDCYLQALETAKSGADQKFLNSRINTCTNHLKQLTI